MTLDIPVKTLRKGGQAIAGSIVSFIDLARKYPEGSRFTMQVTRPGTLVLPKKTRKART